MIISRTPYRVSFFGGGTDYPGWYRKYGGQVISTAIDKYCYIGCRQLPPFFEHRFRVVYSIIENTANINDIQHPAVREVLNFLKWNDGLSIHYDGDLPARSGLGTSSSFTVGLLNSLYAMRGKYMDAQRLASEAIHVEQTLIGEPVGSQDQIAAAFGGMNRIRFHQDGGFDVTPVIISSEIKQSLKEHLVLYFTGISRYSCTVAEKKIKNLHDRKKELDKISDAVDEAIALFSSNTNIPRQFGELLDTVWQEKRAISSAVSNNEIDEIYTEAKAAGAIGGKLLGAGGGGFFLLCIPPEKQQAVEKRLSQLIRVPFGFDTAGSKIALYQPNGLAGAG